MEQMFYERNAALVNLLKLTPEKHNQQQWTCGSQRCYCGWAIEFWGDPLAQIINTSAKVVVPIPDAEQTAEGVYSKGQMYGLYTLNPTSTAWTPYQLRYDTELADFKKEFGKYYWGYAKDIHAVGAEALGITLDQAYVMFDGNNTIEDIEGMVQDLADGSELRHNSQCDCDECDRTDYYYGDDDGDD